MHILSGNGFEPTGVLGMIPFRTHISAGETEEGTAVVNVKVKEGVVEVGGEVGDAILTRVNLGAEYEMP